LAAVGAAGGAAGAGAAAAGAAAAAAAPPLAATAGAAANVANNLGRVPAQANAAAASMNNVSHAAGNAADRSSFLNRTLSMAFAFSGGVAVTNVIGFITNALVGFNSQLEQTRIAFATFMGSGDLADAFIKKMQAFANITPFEFTGLKDSVQRLMAMGFAAEDTLPVLQAVGDAVAATGGNAERLDRITVALGQMYTAGRVNAQDMRQLTEAMVPAWKMLADAMGTSVAEARKAVTAGLVPASEGISAVLRGMEKSVAEGGFGGMMAKQARTAAGALSTLHDVALQTISGAIEPVFNAIADGMVALSDFLITGGTKFVLPALYAIGAAITLVAVPKIWGMIASVSAATVTLGGMSAAEIAAAQAAHVAAGGVGELAIATGGLTIPILPLIVAVTALGIAWQENFGGMRDTLQPVVKTLGDALGTLAGFLGQMGINAAFLMTTIVALAAAITTKFVVSLVASAAAMLGNIILGPTLAVAISSITITSEVATVAVGGLTGALTRLLALIGGVAGVIGLWVTAAVLLVMNFDQVTQGVRVLGWSLLGLAQSFLGLFSSIPFLGDWAKDAIAALEVTRNKVLSEMASMEEEINRKKAEAAGASATSLPGYDLSGWEAQMDDIEKRMKEALGVGGAGEVAGATQGLVAEFGTSLQGVVDAAKDAGGSAMTEMAKAIKDKQDAPLAALKDLRELAANQLDPMTEIARLQGMMASKDLVEGLRSQDAPTRAAAEGLRLLIIERLDDLTGGAYSAGASTTAGLAAGIASSPSLSALTGALGQVGTFIAGELDKATGTDRYSKGLPGLIDSMVGGIDKLAAGRRGEWASKWEQDAETVSKAMAAVNAELAKTVDNQAAVDAFLVSFSGVDLSQLDEFGRTAGAELMQGVADGIQSRQNAPLDKMKNLREMLKTELSVTTQIALLYGAYISQDLANGLASEDPAVKAAALVTRKSITDQLDILTGGAFSAGTNTAANLAAGVASSMSQKILKAAGIMAGNSVFLGMAKGLQGIAGFLQGAADAQGALKNAWDDAAPSAAAATKAYNQWAASLDGAKSSADSYASAMKSALESVAGQARTFFQKLHDDTLKAIDDANKLKNTLLQKPVTAQQEWLSQRQKAIQEANLRRAVTTATSPDAQLSAVQALKEFLLQKQIDANQAAVDTQVNLNNDLTEKAKAAEDARYQNQLNSFDEQMRALQDYLTTHRVTWQVAQAKVISLLRTYGINYKIAGQRLGFSFEQGLRDSIKGVVDAAKDLGSAAADTLKSWITPVEPTKKPEVPAVPTVPKVTIPEPSYRPPTSPRVVPYDTGSWKLLTDTLALVHQGEMIVPATIADSVRDLIKTGSSSSLVPLSGAGAGLTGTTGAGASLPDAVGRGAGSEGGGTIIVQIGNEVIDEIVDRRLYVRGTIYRQTSTAPSGSLR
jgi:tape measure domain-containing protein